MKITVRQLKQLVREAVEKGIKENGIYPSGSRKVTFVSDNDVPAEGTPQRASHDADEAGTVEAHKAAREAWENHRVASMGGNYLRRARIDYHTAKIAELMKKRV